MPAYYNLQDLEHLIFIYGYLLFNLKKPSAIG